MKLPPAPALKIVKPVRTANTVSIAPKMAAVVGFVRNDC